MTYKNIIRSISLLSLVGSIIYYVMVGEHGVMRQRRLQQHVQQEKDLIITLETDINHLKNDLQCWHQNPWYEEQYARQDLCMGCTNELVYLLPKAHSSSTRS